MSYRSSGLELTVGLAPPCTVRYRPRGHRSFQMPLRRVMLAGKKAVTTVKADEEPGRLHGAVVGESSERIGSGTTLLRSI